MFIDIIDILLYSANTGGNSFETTISFLIGGYIFMNPVIGQCPICGNNLHVTRLNCRNCDTTIDGHFTLGRLYQLSPEQLDFVEVFLRCEGKINRVEQEIGLSYPAVRARLTDVIRALGYEVGDTASAAPVVPEETRRDILNELQSGKLTAEEALQMLRGDGE